jgi:hypothetical protein
MKVRCTGLSSPSYAEEQALKRMTGPYQHTKKSRIGNRKITLFYHRPCKLITFVFVPPQRRHSIMGFFIVMRLVFTMLFLLSTPLLTQVSHIQFSYLPIDILLTDWLRLPWLEKEMSGGNRDDRTTWMLEMSARRIPSRKAEALADSYLLIVPLRYGFFRGSLLFVPLAKHTGWPNKKEARPTGEGRLWCMFFLDSISGREYRICSFFLCSSASAFEHTCKGRVSCKQEARKKGIEPITNSNWGFKENCPQIRIERISKGFLWLLLWSVRITISTTSLFKSIRPVFTIAIVLRVGRMGHSN